MQRNRTPLPLSQEALEAGQQGNSYDFIRDWLCPLLLSKRAEVEKSKIKKC